MKAAALRIANTVARSAAQFRPLVLAYHGVDDPATFERQMRRLRDVRHVMSLHEFAATVEGGGGFPRNAALVTFDDGDRSLLESGAPILSSLGIPAVSFVITGLLGTDAPFWWSEAKWLSENGGRTGRLDGTGDALVRAMKLVPNVERLAVLDDLRSTAPAPAPRQRQLDAEDLGALRAAGVEVGSHTVSHPCLDRCDAADVANELRRSRERLVELLGDASFSFAYPNGNVTDDVAAQAKAAGYRLAFAFDHRFCGRTIDPMRVPRVRVDSTTPLDRSDLLISGIHPLQHRLRGRR